MGDENSEYGTALGFSNENFRTQLGLMGRPILKADATGLANRTLLDFTAGLTFGFFSLDLEYAQIDDPNKNTITPLDNTDREKSGYGFMTLATFKINEAFLMGVRYEHVQNDPVALSVDTIDSYGLSAHYKLASDFELRSEYVSYNFKDLASNTWDDSRLNVAGLLTF